MKNPIPFPAIRALGAAALWSATTMAALAQGETLVDDLVSYWPLDEIQGTKTPDIKSGYDFNLENLTEADLVPGRYGQAFAFNGINTYLWRIHAPGEDLPAINHLSFTVSFWALVNGSGQNDKRMFSEATNISDPLFNIGTHSGGSNGAVDLLLRQSGTTALDHLRTQAQPLDGADWHHIIFRQELQPDGSSTRRFYVDGVATLINSTPDANFREIPNKPANQTYSMDRTSIGAILRANPSAFIVGMIDDVAIWKRALTEEEITDLHANGMPEIESPFEPLAIYQFTADYGSVVEGGKVRLRWDVTKDATITLTPGPGDVTGLSSFGVGSVEVDVAADELFTLTVSRGGEELEEYVTVTVVPDVAPDWNWVEDFEYRNFGTLANQPRWVVTDGVVEVRSFAETLLAGVTAGGDLAGLNLRDLGIAADTRRTLFFRFYQDSVDADLPVNLLVGLTEKSLRGAGDFGAANANNGTLVRFFRNAGDANVVLQARNGPGTDPYVTAAYTFLPGYSYNVWIDIENHPLNSGEPDTFSVHVSPEGGARTTVFENFVSDRLSTEVPILGFPREPIDTLVIVAPNIMNGTVVVPQASQAVLLDDFYMSTADSWVSTVPVPGTLPGPPPESFRITSGTRNADGSISLTWNSEPGANYYIQTSIDLVVWERIDEIGVASQGGVTTVALPGPYPDPERFFRIER